MGAEIWGAAGVLAAAIAAFIGHLILRPKIRAEALRSEAEAHDRDWARFQREIERLDHKIAELQRDVGDRSRREAELKRQNRRLRSEVGKLRMRIEELESILRSEPQAGGAIDAAQTGFDAPA